MAGYGRHGSQWVNAVSSRGFVLILVHTDQNFLFISYLGKDMVPANEVLSREETVPSVMIETEQTDNTGWYEKGI